jgi:hypothetical protein
MLAVAGVWALGAVALPWLVRGRSAAADLVLGMAWAGAMSGATTWVARAVGQVLGSPAAVQSPPRGALAAAVVGALLAVAARAARGARPGGSIGAPRAGAEVGDPAVRSAAPAHRFRP